MPQRRRQALGFEARVASAIRGGGGGGCPTSKSSLSNPIFHSFSKHGLSPYSVRQYWVLGVRGLFSCVNLPGTDGVQTFWLNIILGASVKVFLDEMNI